MAFVSSATTDLSGGGPTGPERFVWSLQDNLAPFNYATIVFLFGSGPNKSDSMARVLGFEPGVDTTPDPVTSGVSAPYLVNVRPFRYFDVSIKEFPEFKPHSRIFLNLDKYSQPTNPNPRCTRLLTRPLQRLSTFTVLVTLPGNRPLSWRGDANHELEFEILSIEPSINIPGWVKQELTF